MYYMRRQLFYFRAKKPVNDKNVFNTTVSIENLVLTTKINSLENYQATLTRDMQSIESRFAADLANLDVKVDTVRVELTKNIEKVSEELTVKFENEIDKVNGNIEELKEDMYTRLNSMQDSANLNAARAEYKLDEMKAGQQMILQLLSKQNK